MRILVIGAGGIIGYRLLNKFTNNAALDFDYLVAIDNNDVTPLFNDDEKKRWISRNLNEITPDEWNNIIQENNIDRIFYLHSLENLNMYIPDSVNTLNKISEAENNFIEALGNIVISPEAKPVEILFISTDKIYWNDEFPNETHPVTIDLEINTIEDSLIKNYSSLKVSSELKLLSLNNINLRILRPFSIVAPENKEDFPLTKVILQAMSDVDLEIFGKGSRGLVFTHAEDLASFLTQENLFDSGIELLLSSKIINFSRVWNYLSEYLLYRKLKDKLDSNSTIVPLTETDNFKYMMNTPQIRNMVKIGIPKITIDQIIEEIAYARTPQNTYEPLVITRTYYTENNILHIAGTGEPNGVVYAFLSTGATAQQTIFDNGVWDLTFDLNGGIDPSFELSAEIRILSPEGIHYQTEVISVPEPGAYQEPDIQPLIVDRIQYQYAEGSDRLPYLVLSGTANPQSIIDIDIPNGSSVIHLSTVASTEGGSWSVQTLAPFYNLDDENEGTIRASLEDGSIYATYIFEVPITPSTPPAEPPVADPQDKIEIDILKYLQETDGLHRTYLQIAGKAAPFSKVIIELPPCSDSYSNEYISAETSTNENGDWLINIVPPYYQREAGLQGQIKGIYLNEELYYMISFDIPETPSELLPPEPEPIADLELITCKYNFIDGNPYLYLSGKGEPNYKIDIDLIAEKYETIIETDGSWQCQTEEPFINLSSTSYGTVEMLNEENLILKSIKFLIPITPVSDEEEDRLYIDVIDLVNSTPWNTLFRSTDILRLEGRASAGGLLKITVPADINGLNTKTYEVIVDANGNWTFEEDLGFYLIDDHTLTGKAEAYNSNGIKYQEEIFKIPEPDIYYP